MESNTDGNEVAGGLPYSVGVPDGHTNKPRRSPTGKWTYPSSEDVLSKVRIMHRIAEYIMALMQTIASFIINQPIFSFCEAGERRRGTSPHQF